MDSETRDPWQSVSAYRRIVSGTPDAQIILDFRTRTEHLRNGSDMMSICEKVWVNWGFINAHVTVQFNRSPDLMTKAGSGFRKRRESSVLADRSFWRGRVSCQIFPIQYKGQSGLSRWAAAGRGFKGRTWRTNPCVRGRTIRACCPAIQINTGWLTAGL